MSLNSLTNDELRHRTIAASTPPVEQSKDVAQPTTTTTRAEADIAQPTTTTTTTTTRAEAEAKVQDNPVTNALNALVKYIPTESDYSIRSCCFLFVSPEVSVSICGCNDALLVLRPTHTSFAAVTQYKQASCGWSATTAVS